jgi:hypothetical protein
MAYQVDALQRYVGASLWIYLIENALKGTHDTPKALNARSQLLQDDEHVILCDGANDSSGYIG